MNEGEENVAIEPGSAGAPEGAVAEPTQDEIKQLYEATGVKAPIPTGKAKGRPKTASVRTEDDKKKTTGNSDSGSKKEDDDDKGKSKDAPASNKNGDSGDNPDEKGKKVGEDSTKVSDESKKTDSGVRDTKSEGEEDSKRGGEGGTEQGAKGSGQKTHDENSEEEEGKDDEGKRPGKSNPEVEKRFQKLTEEKRAAEQRAIELEKQLQEQKRAEQEQKIAQEDPEYTIEDFRKVRDRDGNIIDLDAEQAELAWRRWKDGYDQRAAEREAKVAHETAQAAHQEEMQRELMERSVKAYDSLTSLMDQYPELVSTSDKFDEDFAAEALPIIQESIEYLEGTEPGTKDENGQDVLPVIVGLKIDPNKILLALKNINTKKRSLPLNGVNDNVESRSNVNVPHTRSSDSTVNAANELYKELGIDKRL